MEFEVLGADLEERARCIATAFGVKDWGHFGLEDDDEDISDGWYCGIEAHSGIAVTWHIGEENGMLSEISLYSEKEERGLALLKCFRGYGGQFRRWDLQVRDGGHQLLARGLYRLDFEDEAVLAQLPPLSAHEKLELRLSMPREFWPKAWFDGEAGEP